MSDSSGNLRAVPPHLDVAAHEVRAPVAALVALAAAYGSAATPALRERILALAVQAGRDLDRILLDPLGAGTDDSIDLAAVLTELVERRRHERPGDTRVMLAGLGDDRPVMVHMSDTGVRQIAQNLIDNAAREARTIELSVARAGSLVVLDVRDDGPGVPAGLDPFARGVSGVGSSGLGLWLSRSIAEARGGTLELVPAAAGAHFRLSLRRACRPGTGP